MNKRFFITVLMAAGLLQTADSAPLSEPINVACVGDSITFGYPDPSQSYPIQLQALFDARDGLGAYNVGNFGVSARTLRNDGDYPYMNDYWYTASLASEPDVVIIMLGANDAKVGLNWDVAAKDGTNTSINIYNADYVSLIDSYRALAPTPKILVCTPIPVCTVGNGGTFGIVDTVISDEIVPAVRSVVTAPSDVGLIELNAVFPHDQTAYYAPGDAVHPSATGYGFLAGKIYSAIKSVTATNEYHVAKNGSDSNDGSFSMPFLTIQRAADIAQPGDVINVHEGVYRERIDPPRGGTSEVSRIVYQAAPGDEVVIKGSEPITGWTHVTNDTWKVKVPNTAFGSFNPFRDELDGDWYFPIDGRVVHSASVYLDGHWLREAPGYDEVLAPAGSGPEPYWFTNDKANVPNDGTNEGDEATMTTVWAQFKGINPNENDVEISMRQSIFYPSESGRDYITVRGFTMEHAATPWAPPTYEQVGLIGTHWSKGWIIEDNTIRYSACTGVTLGKYYDPEDNWNYHAVIERSLTNGWNRATVGSHIVRNNHISHCEMSGIVGSLGPIFSTISSNTIHDIYVRRLFDGMEQAGIKLHGAVDCDISGNTISNAVQGIWLDWMAQGTRVHGNFLCDNDRDMFYEVNHGPFLVDNNILCSPMSIYSVSRGGAYAHNLILGSCAVNHNETRAVPYLVAHGTDVVEYSQLCPSGDEQFYNNIFYGYGLATYDNATLPVVMEGNVFLNGATPSTNEAAPMVDADSSAITLVSEADGAYLNFTYDSSWDQAPRPLVTTELLGSALITGIPFEHPDGSPYRIDADFYGAARNTNSPCAGPIVFAGGETNTFKVISYADSAVTPNILAQWNFDEPPVGGYYMDSSGNGNDIAVTVAPTHITDGQAVGTGALNFSAGQYLTLADDPADGTAALPLAGNSFSISYWVRRNNTAVSEYLIGMSDPSFSGSEHSDYSDKALHIGFRSSHATLDFYSDGLDNLLTPADTTDWHHYAVTYDADSKQQRIVIDGNLLTSICRTSNNDFLGDVNANTTAADIKNDFWLGRAFHSANFSGMLDEVRVYDGVISDAEICSLYAAGNPQGPPADGVPVVTTFSGGDAGEGLDFSGDYLYAVNIGGNAQYPPVVQGVSFTNDTLSPGVTVTLGGTGSLNFEYWGTKPEYGSSGNDNWLEAMMQATALSYGTDPRVGIDLDVVAGRTYELQMLFSENALQTAGGRMFDVSVEGVEILDEFTPIPAGAEWSVAPNIGILVTYQVVAGDNVLNIDLTGGSSGDVNPLIQGITLEDVTPWPTYLPVVTTFTGGDVGEGLDFSGEPVYAVNIGGSVDWPPLIQGISFASDTVVPGATVTLGGSGSLKGQWWGTGPSYGDTVDDNWLEALMHATALSYGTDPWVEVDLDVTPGQKYELQMLFSENGLTEADSRKFDIAVEGVEILDEFTPIPPGAEWLIAPHTGVLVTYRLVAGDNELNLLFTAGASGDVNPVIQAVVLMPVDDQRSVYGQWAAGFLPVEIGDENTDYDGDLKSNFYEYVFGGDPTNASVTASTPVLQTVGGEMDLIHAQRAGGTNLAYQLIACTNLTSNSWARLSYDILGTNVTGGELNWVTNRIPVLEPELFIRLEVDGE